ncbi:nitronate monooxygenase family protein [Phenylobacterium sp.]|uniref:NAD(P)H-dependent flavin oxidoreductase n=1 Tax=Phenylobacterium sp. TaxID=1871053 RepID=UPI0027316D70|nr:nitronate monooxygenase [Phenylobacterium sp.]MDP1875749.1 nitronate monooxygenase [Phenylobacterium sp.]
MSPWPDRRILDLFGLDLPILQAPMAGASGLDLALAVSGAGGLGALPCALLTPDQVRRQGADYRQATTNPLNLNFFCHRPAEPEPAAQAAWRERLAPYYRELGRDPLAPTAGASRAPFDEAYCDAVEAISPEVVSFHFGLPEPGLLGRVKATGARVISSATTVAEAVWLAERGCDAVIAMGYEAGGHRGSFLTRDMSAQPGLMALLPQVVDAVEVPVIAAGGVADGRGIAAAFALGAAAVQLGTAYLPCPQSLIPDFHRQALTRATDDGTALTNLFTGRPARGLFNRLMREIGPLSPDAPAFPTAAAALGPLRAESPTPEDFTSLWAGQAAPLAHPADAGELTRRLGQDALACLMRLSGRPDPA